VSGYEKFGASFPTNVAGYALSDGTFVTQPRDCSLPGNCVLRVYCSAGKVALGGGYMFDDTAGATLNITGSRANTRAVQPGIFPPGDNWVINFNTTNIPAGAVSPTLSVFVRCVNAN
jgi:hypothetical protein